jgi:hypothetical protein
MSAWSAVGLALLAVVNRMAVASRKTASVVGANWVVARGEVRPSRPDLGAVLPHFVFS